jgi:hypothetical protein
MSDTLVAPNRPDALGPVQGELRMVGGAFVDSPLAWSRRELNDLRKEYREYSQKSLDKCFSYLNFFVWTPAAHCCSNQGYGPRKTIREGTRATSPQQPGQ